jgi:hypothetical protein
VKISPVCRGSLPSRPISVPAGPLAYGIGAARPKARKAFTSGSPLSRQTESRGVFSNLKKLVYAPPPPAQALVSPKRACIFGYKTPEKPHFPAKHLHYLRPVNQPVLSALPKTRSLNELRTAALKTLQGLRAQCTVRLPTALASGKADPTSQLNPFERRWTKG